MAKLMASLASANRHKRTEAAIKLGEKKVIGALPELRALASDDDDIVSLGAMYACWKLGEDRISIDRFTAALNSGDEELVQQAVHTVCAIGNAMVPKLTPLLRQSPEMAMLALQLLEEVGGSEALEAVRKVESTDREVTALAEEILEDWETGSAEELG